MHCGRWRTTSTLLATSIACAGLFAPVSSADASTLTAASGASTAGRVCPGGSNTVTLPAAPLGEAWVVDGFIDGQCRLTKTVPRLVPIAAMPALANGARVSATNGVVRTSQSKSSADPQATAYQRTWDRANLQLNALYTTMTWTATGCCVVSSGGFNTIQYKSEPRPYRGWYLSYQNLWWSGGCYGCASETLSGNAGYDYQGIFDPYGGTYHNTYLNQMTGKGYGGWSCTMSYGWRNSLIWHIQWWCANGYNP